MEAEKTKLSLTTKLAAVQIIEPKRLRSGWRRRLRGLGYSAAVVLVLVLLGLCRYEVVWTTAGPMLLQKERFTLAESFVPLAWINDAGTVTAQERWPLTFAALRRDGIIKLRPKIIVERRPPGKANSGNRGKEIGNSGEGNRK